ncbi:MAG: TonB-dependent receptor plug domain-containing protein [Mariniphaga sp.]|nr:TonB-dependent receptor plug domain-containing protein [Mariniphaga sp.]
MNKKLLTSILLASVVFLFVNTQAQDRVIHGVVHTFDSIPLMDVKVKVKSSKQTVHTDSLGRFTVSTRTDDKLTVSAKGFFTQKVKLEEKIKFAAINLNLKPGDKNREYAIGYGHVNDKDKLNALANLNEKDADFSQYSNIFDLIKGRFAGVQIINGEIIIRGQNSFSSSNAALIVVDGVPVDGSIIQSIPPAQVKSINVIKDGSSAIYGVRGANGVVIIETKRGND